jgi:hypothetical protein
VGLLWGLQILPSNKNWKLVKFENVKERKLTLIVKEKPNWCDSATGNGFILLEGNQTSDENVNVPGPSIVLNRDELVAIKVINKLKKQPPFIGMDWRSTVILTAYPVGEIIKI